MISLTFNWPLIIFVILILFAVYVLPKHKLDWIRLLESVTDILYGIGDYDKYFRTLREHSRCTHDYNGYSYVYDFKRATLNDVLLLLRNTLILIMKNT